MSRNAKILFTLSIVMNFVLLGVTGGYAVRAMHKSPWQMASKELSPQSREMVSHMFEKMHAETKPIMEEMNRARQELRNVMMQDEFNQKNFDKCMTHLHDLKMKMGEKFAATTREVVTSLPAEERQKMADKFVAGFDWKSRGGSGWRCNDIKDSAEKKSY